MVKSEAFDLHELLGSRPGHSNTRREHPVATIIASQANVRLKQLVNHHQWLFYVTNIRISIFPLFLWKKRGVRVHKSPRILCWRGVISAGSPQIIEKCRGSQIPVVTNLS